MRNPTAILLLALAGPLAGPAHVQSPADTVRSWLSEQARAGARPPVMVKAGSELTPARLLSTDPKGIRVQGQNFELLLPWSAWEDGPALYRFAAPAMEQAPAGVHAAHLRIGLAAGFSSERSFAEGLAALQNKDAAAADAVRAEMRRQEASPAGGGSADPGGGAGRSRPWSDLILKRDGTLDGSAYVRVAANYNQRDIIDYRFGPRGETDNRQRERIPPLPGNSTPEGWHKNGQHRPTNDRDFLEWYSEGGQLLISPDADAPVAWRPGVVQCWNGGIWGFKAPLEPRYSLLNRLTFDDVMTQHGSRAVPDPGPASAAWVQAAGGPVPAPPVTVARTKADSGVTGFVVFTNGLVGVTGTGNEYYHWNVPGYVPRACIRLPANKVPTAAAVTNTQEFVLVTVWDIERRKGQIAVIAVKGPVVGTFDQMPHEKRPCLWGVPNWPGVRQMKLLGFVDLPFAAPVAISIGQDHGNGNGRGSRDNVGLDLDSQAERDRWYHWSGSGFKRTARCGYAVVSSRAENKVAFVDLQPLFQYYRTMYFTTQANYDRTKNEGPAPDQWPFTFDRAPEQAPIVAAVQDVKQPTAVAAGMPRTHWRMRQGGAFAQNAYVAAMDGRLLIFKVGNLMTADPGGGVALLNSVAVGRNPCSIDYGHGGPYGDDLFITCRGDNAVFHLDYKGTVLGVLRDSRIRDVVYTCTSNVGRSFRGADWGSYLLHLMDFGGRRVLNYRYAPTPNIPIIDGGYFEFSSEQPLPGCPFEFTRAEVI